MQQRAKGNQKEFNYDEENNQKQLPSQKHNRQSQDDKIQIKMSQNQWKKQQASFQMSISQDQEQISIDNNSEMVSLEHILMAQHLAYLQLIVQPIGQKLFKFSYDIDRIQSNQMIYHNYEDTIQEYLRAGKSLLPSQEIDFFIIFMHKNKNFKKALDWIYLTVQPSLGDQLILIAYKILQAYLPVKASLTNMELITVLAQHPYNIQYVYLDPRLKMLNFNKAFEYISGVVYFQQHLYLFYQEFLRTILLVLEQYFQNPGYAHAQRINQMCQKPPNSTDLIPKIKKKKKIQKISKTR